MEECFRCHDLHRGQLRFPRHSHITFPFAQLPTENSEEPLCRQHAAPDISARPRIALGAAIHAAKISNNEDVRDLVPTDACPHTLGVEIVL